MHHKVISYMKNKKTKFVYGATKADKSVNGD